MNFIQQSDKPREHELLLLDAPLATVRSLFDQFSLDFFVCRFTLFQHCLSFLLFANVTKTDKKGEEKLAAKSIDCCFTAILKESRCYIHLYAIA